MSFKKMCLVPQNDCNNLPKIMNKTEEINKSPGQMGTSQPQISTIDSRLKNILDSNLNQLDKLQIFKSIISDHEKELRKPQKQFIKLSRKKITPKKKIQANKVVQIKQDYDQQMNEDFPEYKWTKY